MNIGIQIKYTVYKKVEGNERKKHWEGGSLNEEGSMK